MLQPISQVLLAIEKKQQDEIITDSGIKLFINPDYNKEWYVAVTATISALPQKVHPKDKKIIDQLKVGDEIVMSYQVVADFDFSSDGERFMQTTEDNPHTKEFTNGKGEWVKIYALPKFTGISKIQWVGVYQDRNRKVIDGIQGTESEIERWAAQFQYGKTDEYRFNNFFEYNGNEYWKCNPNQIFAKIVDGHLVAIGDRVIMKPVEEDVPREIANQILRGGDDVKIRYQDRARVITGGKDMGIKKDKVVSFSPLHLEKYDINNKQYYIINQSLVNGIWDKKPNLN